MNLDFIKQAGEGLLSGVGNIISRFKGDPTKMAELESEIKRAVLEHEVKLIELSNKEIELGVRDRESARNREAVLKNSIGVWIQNLGAAFIILVFGTMLFVVLWVEIPDKNKELFYTLFGVLGTLTATIFNYWFGSSQGSANKEFQINRILKGDFK